MKVLTLVPLAVAASALVIPDADVFESLAVQDHKAEPHPFWKNVKDPAKIWVELEEKFDQATRSARHKFADVVENVQEAAVQYSQDFQSAFAGQAWLESEEACPQHSTEDGPPHRRPHHPPHHHHKPEKTVYQLINESEYTTKLAAAVNEFPDLVELLNGTTSNFTLFVPIDSAFEKIPKGAPKPPKEFLKKLLTYHVSPELYPAGRILVSRTIPTALEAEFIGNNPQRLSTSLGFTGLYVNFYSHIVAVDVFGTNGVIHGVDSILLPPPKVIDIISFLPGEFSTFELGLRKTGLYEAFNRTDLHEGGTLFAPSNFAFQLLGPRINAFLFSEYGLKYLKALLLYHAGPDLTLYSDAIYKAGDSEAEVKWDIPRSDIHIDLPTGLENKSLSIDVARFGRLVTLRINGFTDASVLDGVAADGVIHVVSQVLIPPRDGNEPGELSTEDMTLEEFKDRLEPYVQADQTNRWEL